MPKGRRDADGKACKDADGKIETCCTVPCDLCDTASRTFSIDLTDVELNPTYTTAGDGALGTWIESVVAAVHLVPFAYSDETVCQWNCRVCSLIEYDSSTNVLACINFSFFVTETTYHFDAAITLEPEAVTGNGTIFTLTGSRGDTECDLFSGSNEITDFGTGQFQTLGKNGTVTITASDAAPDCGAIGPVSTTCKTTCTGPLCVDVWIYDGSDLHHLRWRAEKTGTKTWTATTTVELSDNEITLSITCNEDEEAPRWIMTITDERGSPVFGTIVFSGDGTVCPQDVGLWELESSTEEFNSIIVRQIVQSEDCPVFEPSAAGCHQCPEHGDPFTLVSTYIPGGGAVDGACAAAIAYGAANTISGTYNSVSGKWEGTIGTPGVPGYVQASIQKTGEIGGYCSYLVSMDILGEGGNSALLSDTFIGGALSFSGSSTGQSPCTGTPKSRWNVTATMSPSKCFDEPADPDCQPGESDDQGNCL